VVIVVVASDWVFWQGKIERLFVERRIGDGRRKALLCGRRTEEETLG